MPLKLNETAYRTLIQEDKEWLEQALVLWKNTYPGRNSGKLEHHHILAVLDDSIRQHYPNRPPEENQYTETQETCLWEYDGREDYWESACGSLWCFIAYGPEENSCRFCHKCGRLIVQFTEEEVWARHERLAEDFIHSIRIVVHSPEKEHPLMPDADGTPSPIVLAALDEAQLPEEKRLGHNPLPGFDYDYPDVPKPPPKPAEEDS